MKKWFIFGYQRWGQLKPEKIFIGDYSYIPLFMGLWLKTFEKIVRIDAMGTSDLLAITEAAMRDSWCQECGIEETRKVLEKLLPQYGIPIPQWDNP